MLLCVSFVNSELSSLLGSNIFHKMYVYICQVLDCEQSLFSQSSLSSAGLERVRYQIIELVAPPPPPKKKYIWENRV